MPPRAKNREELKAQIKARAPSRSIGSTPKTPKSPSGKISLSSRKTYTPKTEQQRHVASGINANIRKSWDKYMGPQKVSRKVK